MAPMTSVAALIIARTRLPDLKLFSSLRAFRHIQKIIVLASEPFSQPGVISLCDPYPEGGGALQQALHLACECSCILMFMDVQCDCTTDDMESFIAAIREGDAVLCYADYFEADRRPEQLRCVCDYQLGSIRDDFDFGPVLCCDSAAVHRALTSFGTLADTRWAGLYELRLKLSCVGSAKRISKPLSCIPPRQKSSHFRYVDPSGCEYQREMEQIATDHLRRIGALCTHALLAAPDDASSYPVVASVVIPVRNRERTIADALRSALSQQTDFPFNVLVVDNHSTDRTSAQIERIARNDKRVVRIVPERTDLGIGGCWNVAVQSALCGRYVCQLDSDDLYAHEHSLAAMTGMLRYENFGMVVGSYRVVDFSLREIPPGVVDHREWSDDNGRNNILRVAGIGAPRAFSTCLLRTFPFPNVSYGEDYAVALRISRDYHVGRIYEPLYLCRRWDDNSDAELNHDQAVRYATYKDSLRTQEILERQRLYKQ